MVEWNDEAVSAQAVRFLHESVVLAERTRQPTTVNMKTQT